MAAGQKYYIEAVMHNGGGGDNWAMTYQTTTEVASGLPVDTTSATQFAVASNNIVFATWPGTAINWSSQPRPSITVNEGQSTNLTAIAVTDAELTPTYQWFLVTSGGSLPGTALTGKMVNGTNLTMSLIPAGYNNAQVYCVASTVFGGLSVTSSVATLHVIQSVFEPGWVSEKKWMDVFNMTGAENGTIGNPTLTGIRVGFQAGLDNPGSLNRDNTIQQIGYFVPPTSGNYVFFLTSHDNGDLFLSTDNTAVNKRLVAQEAGWSGNFAWNQAGGGGTIISQKRSDTFTNSTSGGTAPYAAGIPLVAGQRYYMEVDHTTSRWGNEQFGVTYRVMSGGVVTAPNDGDLPNAIGNVVGMNAVRCSYVNFTQQPSNVTAAPMGYATFAVDGVTDSQYPPISSYGVETVQSTNALFYQWYKNGVAIPGATAKTLTMGPLLAADNGATIYCAMRALGFANDSLTPIWTNSTSATLTISPQPVLENGVARVDWWSNTTSRVSVENGGAGSPTFSFVAPKFESPTENSPWNNYVNRVSGYFVAPSNGIYIFYISGDDDSDLFISTDANPANKKLVARQTSWSNPFQWVSGNDAAQRRSDTFSPDGGVTLPGNPGYVGGLPMVAGQKYWLEGVHHNGGGGNNFEVTFRELYDTELVDGTDSRLGGNLIASYVPRIPWVAFLQQPVSQSVTSGGNPVTFTALGTNPPSVWIGTTGNPNLWLTNPPTRSVRYQWYKNNVAIPGATGSSYTLPYVLPSDQGAQFVCAMRALGYADDSLNPIYSNSVPAVLTVVTDTVPPTVSYAVTFQNTNQVPPQFIVDVTFSEWMDAATLSNPANYSGVSGITNISIASNHRTVQLLLNSMPTLPLNITVSGVKDLSGNSIVGTPSVAIKTDQLTFSDVGTPGVDPAYPSYVWITSSNGYIVSAEGSDIWNAVDGFNFGWEMKTNDFDMVVRGVSITPTSQWAKQGLMVRETLDANSREWSIQNEPLAADGGANRIDTSMRSTNGLASVGWSIAGTLPPPSYPNAWLRLKRTGSFLDGYYSTNGVDWVHATSYNTATNDVPLGSVVYFGICTTAHNNDVAGITPPSPFLYYNTVEYANYGPYVPQPNKAVLTASRSGTDLIISWTPAGGHLEASPALSGPSVNWQTVTSSNPATVPIATGARFFRVVNP
ncbi:MAG TPA: PA14 domain-containing protein [Candidatus Paceibacterota bacterium]|nr:PA14 domain-containing protein [Candidatus Paceibacterota bacterium]